MIEPLHGLRTMPKCGHTLGRQFDRLGSVLIDIDTFATTEFNRTGPVRPIEIGAQAEWTASSSRRRRRRSSSDSPGVSGRAAGSCRHRALPLLYC